MRSSAWSPAASGAVACSRASKARSVCPCRARARAQAAQRRGSFLSWRTARSSGQGILVHGLRLVAHGLVALTHREVDPVDQPLGRAGLEPGLGQPSQGLSRAVGAEQLQALEIEGTGRRVRAAGEAVVLLEE